MFDIQFQIGFQHLFAVTATVALFAIVYGLTQRDLYLAEKRKYENLRSKWEE